MDIMNNFWNNIEGVHKLGAILQWLAFASIFLGLVLGILKYFADQREKYLLKTAQAIKETEQNQLVKGFETKVKSLGDDLSKSKEEVDSLKKKTGELNPYKQLIRTATSTVEVTVESNENINTQYMDKGGYLAICKGQDALLVTSATSCFARQLGNNQVLYRGVFELNVTSDVTQKPVSFLKTAEYIQIWFVPMAEKSMVLNGKAICTINNNVRLEFYIPPQKMSKELIIIPNIAASFVKFNEK
jgi:hypothetical protein